MKLKLYPPSLTNADIVPAENARALPALQMHFYSTHQKVEAMIMQTFTENGDVIDTAVISVSPRTGKIAFNRKSQPIEIPIDRRKRDQ